MANWAICIGINQYDDLQPLKFAVRDAERMKDWLINKAGFPASQVYFFADDAPQISDAGVPFEAKPTFATVFRFLDRRFEKSFLKPGDNLWFFFSGHGMRFQERDYLMFADSSADSTLIDRTAIATNFIVERLRRSGADNVMLFIDACREGNKSGRGLELEKEQGIITLASCSPNEFSYEIDELEHGSFTYALLESLDFQGENNCATVERLNRRLRDRVKEINNVYGKPRQTPRSVIEPASKYHLILLPEYIRPTDHDIAVLKNDALNAELLGDLRLAKSLWTRLVKLDTEDSLAALERIWEKSRQRGTEPEVESEFVANESGKKSIDDGEPEVLNNQASEKSFGRTSSGLSTFKFEVVTVDDYGKESKRATKQAEYFVEELGNGVTLDMVAIPDGSFWMGTEEDEIERLCNINVYNFFSDWFKKESPRHKVNVDNFFMGRYPITQAQWREVAGWEKVARELNPDPSKFKDNYEGIDRWIRPVEQVSWLDAKEFCDRLSKKTRNKYRLPSEAEWEYAARAETNTPFHFGQTISTNFANYKGTDWEYRGKVYPGNYGQGSKGIYREQTTPVGSFKVANNWGLCDMHGNVWEWCEDDWHDNYENAPIDGNAWLTENSTYKVLSGGSWDDISSGCRSAARISNLPNYANLTFGFRVVCMVPRIV